MKSKIIKRLIGIAVILIVLFGISIVADAPYYKILGISLMTIGIAIGVLALFAILAWAFDLD